jgi:hypothetical protein
MRYLPIVIELALVIYCLIDCITTDSVLVRNLNKSLWVMLIIFLPVIGSVAWLVAGRPTREQRGRAVPWPSAATAGFPEYERPRARPPARGPDDDPDFLSSINPPSTPPKTPAPEVPETAQPDEDAKDGDAKP